MPKSTKCTIDELYSAYMYIQEELDNMDVKEEELARPGVSSLIGPPQRCSVMLDRLRNTLRRRQAQAQAGASGSL